MGWTPVATGRIHKPVSLIFDRDAKFSADVVSTVKAMGSHPIRTAFRSPWQNGIADLKDIKCLVDSGALRRSKPGRQGRQAGSGCRPRDRATGEKGQRGTCSWREVAVDVENHVGSVARVDAHRAIDTALHNGRIGLDAAVQRVQR